MADGLDRMTLGVEDEGAVIVGVIVGPEAGLAVVLAAGVDGGLVEGVDRLAARGLEGDVGAAEALGLRRLASGTPIQNLGSPATAP